VIILDTNVLSALMQRAPEAVVVRWLDQQAVESVWITSITLFEARLGLALLAAGRRRDALERSLGEVLEQELENKVLDFDTAAAIEAAGLAAARRRAGHSVDFRDTQIAGIALSRRAGIATRNVKHFQDLDVPVVDPWASRPEPTRRQ
jgi:toxin FitB